MRCGMSGMLQTPEGQEMVKTFLTSPEGQNMMMNFISTPQGKQFLSNILLSILDTVNVPLEAKGTIRKLAEQYLQGTSP